jgi:NAD(P)-dependent dehydrogenase (short-subunit alcohol dehydrogenase family)
MGILNDFSLQGKVVVVTGGTGVLGGAFVDAIADAGAAVGVLGRNAAIAEERAEKIRAAGGKAIALIADVMKEEELLNAKELILKEFGKVDGLVNGAGGNMPIGVLQNEEDLFKMNLEGMKTVMDINLWGTIIPTQVFGATLAENPTASIVNISSMNSKQAVTKVLGYNLGKAAVDCYNEWFAVELANRYGDRIRMNALTPGFFLTEQNRKLVWHPDGTLSARGQSIINNTPFKRFGKPEELTGALIWLLSDASRFVTGSQVVIDGGFSIYSGV